MDGHDTTGADLEEARHAWEHRTRVDGLMDDYEEPVRRMDSLGSLSGRWLAPTYPRYRIAWRDETLDPVEGSAVVDGRTLMQVLAMEGHGMVQEPVPDITQLRQEARAALRACALSFHDDPDDAKLDGFIRAVTDHTDAGYTWNWAFESSDARFGDYVWQAGRDSGATDEGFVWYTIGEERSIVASDDPDMTLARLVQRHKRQLDWADLRGADLHGLNLSDAHLDHADLSGANLEGTRLEYARLAGTDLTGADLRDARMKSAWMPGASLDRADMMETDLTGANLRQATMTGATLDGTVLSGARLEGTDLTGADTGRAILYDTDLSDTIGVSGPSPAPATPDTTTPGIGI